MKVNLKLDVNAYRPTKAHDTDAGFDLYTPYDFKLPPATCVNSGDATNEAWLGSAIIDTGVHIEIPKGYVGFIKSKSGLNIKQGITAEGVIDSGYTGSIVVKLYNNTEVPYYFKAGNKITQLVILPIPDIELVEVEEFADTERGDNGFGSSGI